MLTIGSKPDAFPQASIASNAPSIYCLPPEQTVPIRACVRAQLASALRKYALSPSETAPVLLCSLEPGPVTLSCTEERKFAQNHLQRFQIPFFRGTFSLIGVQVVCQHQLSMPKTVSL